MKSSSSTFPCCSSGARHRVQIDGVADGKVSLPGETEDCQDRDIECPEQEKLFEKC